MTLMRFVLRPGQPIFEQVVFTAKIPSVRTLAAELKIHPNTAHKVIQHLIQERWLEVHPGIGTVVAEAPQARPGDKKRLLQQEVEQLVVESKRVGLSLREVVEAIGAHWGKLDKTSEGKEA